MTQARRLDENARVVLSVNDSQAAQPRESRLVVRGNRVPVEDSGPETGDRRWMTRVKDNIVKSGHSPIMRPAAG